MCPYGDKDDRCSLMMRLNKKFYCENYGSTCCESCFKTARRPEVTTPFPVFISARRPDTAASRIRSQTQSQSEPKASASRSANSSRNNLEKVRENLKRFVTFINQIFSRNNNVGWEKHRQLFSSSMFISILPHIQLNQTFKGQKLCSFRFERRLWRMPYPSLVFPQTQVDSVVWYKMKCQRLVNRNQLLRI